MSTNPTSSTNPRYIPLSETTTFPSADGLDIILALWKDNDSGREYIQCDLCHKFFLVNERRYPITFGKRRNNATCQKTKEILERKQMVAATTSAANLVAETLFHPKARMSSASLIDFLRIRHYSMSIYSSVNCQWIDFFRVGISSSHNANSQCFRVDTGGNPQ